MTIVKELNELAKKMTGTNPKARTDAQALDYIEQHYQGGDTPQPTPQSKFDYIIPSGIYEDISGEITDENAVVVLEEISNNYLDENGKIKPLIIGAYITNDDDGSTGFVEVNAIEFGYGKKVTLCFISRVAGRIHSFRVYYNTSRNKWETIIDNYE